MFCYFQEASYGVGVKAGSKPKYFSFDVIRKDYTDLLRWLVHGMIPVECLSMVEVETLRTGFLPPVQGWSRFPTLLIPLDQVWYNYNLVKIKNSDADALPPEIWQEIVEISALTSLGQAVRLSRVSPRFHVWSPVTLRFERSPEVPGQFMRIKSRGRESFLIAPKIACMLLKA